MRYRIFGRTGWKVSALGLGCMRMPNLGAPDDLDDPASIRLIRHAVDRGVNYLDSGYGYHGGRSEVVLGMALADGYRQRVKLVTKMPTWLVKEARDFDGFLGQQLGGSRPEPALLHGHGEIAVEAADLYPVRTAQLLGQLVELPEVARLMAPWMVATT